MSELARLRTVIIGFGEVAAGMSHDDRMARFFRYATHAEALANHPAYEWAAVVDIDSRARACARTEWHIPHCAARIEELVASYQPEVAVLTAPHWVWKGVIEATPTLRAIVAEKPLGLTDEERDVFLNLCRQRNIVVQVNYWRRFATGLRELANGKLLEYVGEPQAVFATYGRGLHNNGSHLIDFLRMLFGEVLAAQTIGAARPTPRPRFSDDIDVPFALTHASGVKSIAGVLDFDHYREVGIDVWGSLGRLTLLQESLVATVFPRAENRGVTGAAEIASDTGRIVECPVGDAFFRMYDNLSDSIRHGSPVWSSGENAARTERALSALHESIDRGGIPVRL
ncbi:MAG: Gfo/Idh/MocA family oxidoreductase [Planctomycetes bacterium]|nr:Gfo/Idh/MocA family oxidoreductase [Planctomycetota bacterium]